MTFIGWRMTRVLTCPRLTLTSLASSPCRPPTPAPSCSPVAPPHHLSTPHRMGGNGCGKLLSVGYVWAWGAPWGHAKSPGPETMRSGLQCLACVTSGIPLTSTSLCFLLGNQPPSQLQRAPTRIVNPIYQVSRSLYPVPLSLLSSSRALDGSEAQCASVSLQDRVCSHPSSSAI